MISSAQRRLLLLTATFALSLLSCGREVTGPENGINYGRGRFGAVSLDPQMPSLLASLNGASTVVPFERVRVVLRREDGTISVDTLVEFPVGADSIALSLLVPLPFDTPAEGLPLSLTMAYINAVGDTVFRGGPVGVIAPPLGSSATQQPVTIPIAYDGIGKDAARVAISPDSITQVAGTTSTFTATAFDGADAPIANTPIVYFTLDSARASIPNAGNGQVTWLPNRGVARIVAALPNGARADTAFVTVALPASKLVLQSGNAQSGIVSSTLSEPVVLRTLASDDVPVAGVIVTFAVASGNGTLSVATDTSDVNGVVSTNWTLGAGLGAQTITASSVGLTGSPTTVTATATAGTPAQVAFTQLGATATAGTALTPPALVAVQDVAGNLVTTFTGPVSVEVTAASSGPVNGTLTVNAVGGVASFADLSFDVAGTYTLVAVLDSTARDTSAVITVAPGAGAILEFVEQPVGAVAGVAFAPPVTVTAKDAQGNIATGFTGTVTLSLINANGATLGGSLSVAAVDGLATFSGITVDRVGSTYALAAASGSLIADTSATFGIVPAEPAAIALIAGEGQTGPAGTILPNGIVVEVRDAFLNPIPGVTVNFSAVLGGGSSSSASEVTDGLGRAATTWTLGPDVGDQVLRAEVSTNPLATIDIAATATVGAPAVVAFTQSPSVAQVAGVSFPDVIVEVRDANGNVVTNYSGLVGLSLGSNPSGATLLGTASVAAVNGVATFSGIALELAGVGYTLQAAADTLPAAVSSAFDVLNATASLIVPVAGDGQSGTVGTLLADSLVVRVTDQFGNKVVGIAVTFAEAVGFGSVAPATVITNALGEAATSWTLGGSFGPQAVNAVILDGAAIYTFSATATVAAPAIMTVESGDAQVAVAGSPFPGPVRVLVTDAFGNRVAGAQVAWAGFAATVAADTTLTDGNGVAEVIATAPPEVGGGGVSATLVAAPSQFVIFSVTVVAAEPATPVLELQPTNTIAGTAITPFTVRVEDAFGNLATSYNGPVTLTAELLNGTPAAVITAGDSVNAVDGLAEFTATRIDQAGTYRLIANLGVLGTVVSNAFTIQSADPSQLVLVDGDGQTAGVSQVLPAPLRVRVTDAFGNSSPFVLVTWSVTGGSAGLSDSVSVTDTSGVAQTTVTLGGTSGTVSIDAIAAGLTGSPVSFTATATAGAAVTLVTISGDGQVATAGTAFPLPLVVRVLDAFGNGVSGVDVTFDLADGASAFSDTVVTTDANGLASVIATAATIANAEGSINVTAAGLSPVSFGVSVDAGAATELVYQSLPLGGTAGVAFSPIVVAARDAFGNVATGFADSMTIAIDSGAVGAVLGGTVTRAPVSGLVFFDDLVFTTASSYTLTVSSGALSQTSPAIVVAAAAAATIAAEGAPERAGLATSIIAPPLFAKITDAFGNPVSGETVNWSVASGSVTLSTPSSVTDAAGVAQVEVTAGSVAESASVLAASGALSGSPVAFPITVTAGPGTQLTLEIGPAGAIAGDLLAPFTVAVRDANGNVSTDFVGDVTIVVDSGPSLTIVGTATVAATGGSATFDSVTFETAGEYRLRFTSPGLTDAVSGIFQMLPGAAANITLLDGDAQSDTVTLALDLPLRVRVTDSFGNGVAGTAVAWAPTALGTVALDTTFTDATGVAQVGFTLGTASGGTTIQASLDGVTGSPVLFSATGIPDIVAALAVTAQPDTVVSGAATSPFTLEARDQYGNVVTWFNGDVSVLVSDAPAASFASGTTLRTAVAGVATFDDLIFSNTGPWFIDFLALGSIVTGASVQVIAGAPANVTIAAGDGQSGVVTQPLPLPLQVLVTDANNNPVVGDTVVFIVTQGGGTLSSLTALDSAVTNSAGIAQTTWTLGADSTSAQTVQADRVGFPTLTFTATPLPFVANRTWTGDVDTDPFNAGNWQDGLLPVSTDSVLVPAGRPNYPVLTATQEMARLTVEDGATIEIGQWSILVNGSLSVLGAAQITSNDSGTVVLQGAGGGTVRGAVPQLFVSAGSYTATGGITTALDLGVTGTGTLDLGTTSSTVGRDFSVTGGGAVIMTSAPSLVVQRDVSYTSSAITTGLTSGVMSIRGNVSANGNFRPSASHTTDLDGAGVQTVTFSAPDESFTATCAAGCFGALASNKGAGGLIFGSSVKAIGGLVITGDTLGASGRTIIGVGSTILNSTATNAGRVAYDQSLSVGALFAADTMVAFGTAGTVPIVSIASIPTRVVGSHTITLNHAGDLLVTDTGVLDVDGASARVNGALLTSGNGRVRMTDATDSLSVGTAQFGGLTDSTFLTSGVLDVRGTFTQSGAGVTTYAAQSAHRLRFTAATAGIDVTSPALNPIGSLHVSDGSALSISSTGVRINGTAVLEGTTATAGSEGAEAVILGGLVDAVGDRWTTATTRFEGGALAQIPVRINSNVVFAGSFALADSLIVTGSTRVTTANGDLNLGGRTLRTEAFATDSGGRIAMTLPTDSIFSATDVTFNGGASVLEDGFVSVGAGFFQTDNGNSFPAAPLHTVAFTGTGGLPSITQVNAGSGAGTTQFGTIRLASGTGTTLSLVTDVQASRLETTPGNSYTIASAGGSRLVTFGTSASDLTFENIRWELSGSAPASVANIAFGTMDPTVTQLFVAANGGTVAFPGLSFATTPTTGQFLRAQDNDIVDGDTLTVDVAGVSPQFHGGKIGTIGAAKIINWEPFAALNWTNAVGNRDWFNTGNWAEGFVPSASDSVVITGSAPVIGAGNNAAARTLSMASTESMLLEGTLTISRRLSVGQAASGIFCNTGTGQLLLAGVGDSVAFQGEVRCDVRATQGDVALSGFALLDSLAIENGASVTVNGANLTTNILRTQGTGRLVMANALDSVLVFVEAEFGGASTLTAGRLRIYGSFAQTGNPTAFQATAAHTTEFIGVLAQPLSFANPDSSAAGSHFGTFQLSQGAPGISVALGSAVFANGPLLAVPAVDAQRRALFAGTTQTVVSRGADVSIDLDLENVLWHIVEGGPLASSLQSVRFLSMPEGGTQLAMTRNGSSTSLNNFQFDATVTSGTYLALVDSDPIVGDTFTVTMVGPNPGFHGGRISTLGGAILNGWAASGPGIWTGSASGDFGTAANWQAGIVPFAGDSIFIDDSALNTLTISSPTTIGAISLIGGQLNLQDTLTVTGTASLGSGSTFCGPTGALRVAYAGLDSVAFSMNTAECNAYVSDGRVYLDQAASLSTLFAEQDAIVDVNGRTLTTAGDLIFTETARLVMTENADTVRVGSQARFQGGDETGLLTAGALIVSGTFLQGGSTTAFASSGSLHVFLGDSTSVGPTQYSIDFNNPATSPINRLTIFDNRLAFGPVNVSGQLRMADGAALTGVATTALGGFRLEGLTSSLSVDRLAVAGELYVEGAFTPDTADFLGAGAVLQEIPSVTVNEDQLVYKTLRVLGDSARMKPGIPYQITDSIVVAGNGMLIIGDAVSPSLPINVLADSADLVVEGDGRLRQLADGELRLASARFVGGNHAGMLTRGDLVVHGNFAQNQNGAVTQTFLGSDLHRVIFDGTGSVLTENPTDSRFAGVVLAGPVQLTLLNDIVVDSALVKAIVPSASNITLQADELTTALPWTITVRGGISFPTETGTTALLRNVALRLEGDANNGTSVALADVTFQDMDSTSTFLDIDLLNFTLTFDGIDFAAGVTTGKYFDIAEPTTTITFLNGTPAVGCINAPEGCVGPRFEPSAPELNTWLGLTNDWTQGSNWSLGAAPVSFQDVLIPVTGNNPLISFDGVARNLTVESGATLALDASVLTVNGTALDVQGSIAGGTSIVELRPPGAPTVISGGGSFAPELRISTPSSGAETTVTLTAPFDISNTVRVNANTLVLGGQTLRAPDFFTGATGRLMMTNAADSLDVLNATFAGESTDGMLTEGKLVVRANFAQGGSVATAFAASNNHLTIVAGGGPRTYTFANPGPTDSHFGSLRVEDFVFDDTLLVASDIQVNGQLQTAGTRLIASNVIGATNRHLSAFGFSNAGGLSYFGNVRVSTQSVAGINLGASMFFTSMDPNVTQLSIEAPGGTVTIGAVTFSPLSGGDLGKYLSVNDNLVDGDSLRVNIPSRSPEGHEGFIEFTNEAQILGWDSFALYTFTGATSGDFNDVSNWDVGAVPTSTSNVLVANVSGFPLAIDAPTTIKKLTMGAGPTAISLTQPLFTTGVQGGFDLVSGTKSCSGAGVFVFNDPSPGPTFLRSDLTACDLVVQQGNVNLVGDTTNVRDLVLQGGFFNTTNSVRVAGDLAMTGGAILFMGGAADSLIVSGDATFRGQQAFLTDGDLLVGGSLDVGASSPLQFRMESPSHLTLGDPGQSGGLRDITIDPGSQMYVDSLTIQDGFTTITGQLNVRRRLQQITSSTNSVDGETIVLGSKSEDIVGTLTTDAGSQLAVGRFELFGNISSAGDFSPDTADFVGTSPTDNGGIQRIRSSNNEDGNYGYKLVRVFDNAVMDQIPTGIPIAYTIATGLQVLGGQLTVGNAIDTAYVNMGSADLIVSGPLAGFNMTGLSRIIADSAHFQGGITSQLNEGHLVARSLVAAQEGAQNVTLTAISPHVFDLYGSGWLSMNDYANNPLHTVRLTGGAVTSLDTYLRIDGSLGRVADADGLVTLRAGTIPGFAQFIVTPSTDFGVSNSGLQLRNVALSLQASYPEPGGNATLNNVTFTDMDPATIFLQALWSGVSTATWNNINFNSPVSGGGRFFEFATGDPGSAITFTNATPAVGCFVTVCVPTDVAPIVEPSASWTGGSSSAWTDPANWSTGTVPTAGTDVTILGGVVFSPVISTNTGVRSLTVNADASLALDVDDTLSVYDALTVDGTVTGASLTSTLRLVPPVDTFNLSATGAIQTRLAIGSGIGGYDGVVQLLDRVNLTTASFNSGLYLNAGLLDLNGNTLNVNGSFRNFGTSRWKMVNPLDTLIVLENFDITGGSTDGLLTEGEIDISGVFFRQRSDNSDLSFVSTGNHSVRLSGGDQVMDVWFDTPDSTLSRIANLAIDRIFDQWILFDYSRVFVTNLTKVSGRIEVYNDGFGVGQGSDGEIIVTGSVSNVDPNHMFDMILIGKVQLLGVDPATCDGLSFNVQFKMAGFEPISCHSAEYAWTPETGTAAVTSYGAYAASDTDIWVVGANGTIQRGNGSTWAVETSNTSNTLFAVSGTSTTDVWAVGAGGVIVHWDGSSWTPSFQGFQNLNGVFAVSPSLAYAVGDSGTILRWDGNSWTSMTSGTAENLTGIFSAGLLADDLLAVGNNGTLLRLLTGSWTPVPSGTTTNLNATYASTPTGYMVFGENGVIRQRANPFNLFFDALSPTIENLNGAGGNGSAGFAVGANGTVLRFLGESFVPQNALTNVELHGVTVTPNGTAYVVGASGVIQRGVVLP